MGATREALVNGANKEMIPFGKMKFSCLFNQTLDAFLLDYDIKEFLKNYADVWSWDQCDEEVKKNVTGIIQRVIFQFGMSRPS